MVNARQALVRRIEHFFHEVVELIEAVVFVYKFMFYFRPKTVYKRFYLQLELVVFARIRNVAVYAVNVVAVFLLLGLGRVQL